MDTVTTILSRRSIRRYREEPMPAADLTTILECARQAPSAGNRQACHLIAVTDPALRRKVAEACHNQTWMGDASVIVVGLGDPSISEGWHHVDTAIALQNLVLAATSLGYGTCWVGACDHDKLRELLSIPPELRILACIPVGRAVDQPEARPRRDMADYVSLQRYGQQFQV